MSDRNLGVFLPGHVSDKALRAALSALPGYDPALHGEARTGRGEHSGRPFTHLALPWLEEGGFQLLEAIEPPGEEALEVRLGRALSSTWGAVILLHCDEETGWGGGARFEEGVLVYREAVDGRGFEPVRRDLSGEQALTGLDPSEWIWPALARAIEQAAAPLLGPGITTDDHIAALIRAAGTADAPDPRPLEPAAPQMRIQDSGEPGRLTRLVHRLRGKLGRV